MVCKVSSGHVLSPLDISNSLVIQWGFNRPDGQVYSFVLPLALSPKSFIGCCAYQGTANNASVYIYTINGTTITTRTTNANVRWYGWIAIC